MNPTIKIGSVVKLKGQNIKMTVNFINMPSRAETINGYYEIKEPRIVVGCVWFDDVTLCEGEFTLDALELINN